MPLNHTFLKINLTTKQVLLVNGVKKGINPFIQGRLNYI